MHELTKEERGLLAIPRSIQIIPWTEADLAKSGTTLALALLKVAEVTLEQENVSWRNEYNGAERKAMVSQRALKLHGLMELAMDAAGQELIASLKETGPYHPDIRGDSQELIDELVSKGTQKARQQGWYIVNVVFPRAEELGVNVGEWIQETSKWKLMYLVPDFRFVLGDNEITNEERDDIFLNLVVLSTKRYTEIRGARQLHGPEEFIVVEHERGEGYEWNVAYLTKDTRDFALRKLQPWIKRRTP